MKQTPLRPHEDHINVYERLLRLFVPEKGSVLVMNAGTVIYTAVCLELKLRCVCLEEELTCFRLFLGRLRVLCVPYATMQDISGFSMLDGKDDTFKPSTPEAFPSVDDAVNGCLLYTSPSPRDQRGSRMPSSA